MATENLRRRIYFQNRFSNLTPELIVKTGWVSTALALILAMPSLGLFLWLYYSTGNLLMSAVFGFSLHYATLAISPKITNLLERLFS